MFHIILKHLVRWYAQVSLDGSDIYGINNPINVLNNLRITPHAEEFQTVIWHCIVSHPNLQIQKTKW